MSERRPPGGETGRSFPADEHLPDGGTELSPSEIEALGSRWASAWTPDEVARRLAGVGAPWCVAAGWALDLFRGRQTRAHGDIEIAVPAGRFPEVRSRFPGYAFDAAGSGRIWEDAAPDVLAAVHQTWVRDPATGDYLLDVFREPHDGDTWICRRDESIRRPYDEIVHHTRDGIPYLAPELVLLFKAKHARPKDQADFDATVPYLSPEQRASLASLLDRVHPGHPWSAGL
ncbi:nucleotidyltransferase domain-containing protein [Streptomyces rubiginosohelvolus]|uniref:nucleotidyltransferase domain-containing protein n=1 Tax=Streptomyces rubiginosohelvolus TaxID=67362 RepID=UPI00382DE729